MKISANRMAGLFAAVGLLSAGSALAVPCAVDHTGKDWMDTTNVSTCLAAGTGNIGQAGDPFLAGASGAGYTKVSDTDGANPFSVAYTQGSSGANTVGNWSISPTFWQTYSSGAIGFKFGTGDQPDEWFVYSLSPTLSSGSYTFFNIFGTGGGLSHAVLYSGTAVPEPATLALLGAGLFGVGAAARRRRAARS